MKKIAYVLIGLVGILVIAFFALRAPDTDPDAMRAKYMTEASSFTDGASGFKIHYAEFGCSDCPVLVLVHGANASLHTFLPMIDQLKGQYRIITYDQPGHGLTGPDPASNYAAQGHFAALEQVLTQTGVTQFAIAGNSMGGWVAWRYALENPDRLTGLILMNASGAPMPEGAEPARLYLGARIIRHPIGRWLSQYITPRKIIEKSIRGTVADEELASDEMIDRYWELLRYPGNRRAAGLRAIIDREEAYQSRLNEITTPTLIIWGTEDLVTPLYNADTFDQLIPNSRKVILPNVAHLPMEEAPTQTVNAINAFLIAQLP